MRRECAARKRVQDELRRTALELNNDLHILNVQRNILQRQNDDQEDLIEELREAMQPVLKVTKTSVPIVRLMLAREMPRVRKTHTLADSAERVAAVLRERGID